PASGKSDCITLDHAGAVFQHGFPDDPITWTLDQDRRAENVAHAARGTPRAPALTDCPECHAVRFEGQPCPVCGCPPRPKSQLVDVADGDLALMDRDHVVKMPQRSADDQLRFYGQLLYIANERGYQRGWAAHKGRRFGPNCIWPCASGWDARPAPRRRF